MCIEIKSGNKPLKVKRTEKGNSLLSFPSDYVVVDLETTGYSPEYDSILEMCALRVRSNEIIDTFSSLVNSGSSVYIDEFITSLTGITKEMIAPAPDIKDVFPEFINFIDSDIIVGHNVNFDINFLYDESVKLMGTALSNNYVDTMRLSRRLHPEYQHHRLLDLSERYSIDYTGAHRSLKDCEITKFCYDALRDDALHTFGNLEDFFKKKTRHSYGLHAKDISADNQDFDEAHVLYGKVCVFTGTLEKMPRKDAMQIVANLGGVNADSVTKKTNYLILGCNDYCKSIKDGKSNKQKKAEKLQLEGNDIIVIPEDVFYEMAGIN